MIKTSPARTVHEFYFDSQSEISLSEPKPPRFASPGGEDHFIEFLLTRTKKLLCRSIRSRVEFAQCAHQRRDRVSAASIQVALPRRQAGRHRHTRDRHRHQLNTVINTDFVTATDTGIGTAT